MTCHHTYWPLSGFTDVGDVWLTSQYDTAGQVVAVVVERADPRVLVSAKLLIEDFHVGGQPFLTLKCVGQPQCPIGDVFAIEAVNRRLVYVVIAKDGRWLEGDPLSGCYVACWPD